MIRSLFRRTQPSVVVPVREQVREMSLRTRVLLLLALMLAISAGACVGVVQHSNLVKHPDQAWAGVVAPALAVAGTLLSWRLLNAEGIVIFATLMAATGALTALVL
jgi:hypothetical protein